MKPLDLFPGEPPRNAGIPLQGRIMLRNQQYACFEPSDIPRLIELGLLEEKDDADQAQRIGTHGFPAPSVL